VDEEYNEHFDTSLKFLEKNYGCHIVSKRIYTSSEEMQLFAKIRIVVSILLMNYTHLLRVISTPNSQLGFRRIDCMQPLENELISSTSLKVK
jgi:hypothetical protein